MVVYDSGEGLHPLAHIVLPRVMIGIIVNHIVPQGGKAGHVSFAQAEMLVNAVHLRLRGEHPALRPVISEGLDQPIVTAEPAMCGRGIEPPTLLTSEFRGAPFRSFNGTPIGFVDPLYLGIILRPCLSRFCHG